MRQGDGGLGACAWRAVTADPAWQTEPERLRRILHGRLRDECLNEHWFPTLLHARTEIERWRREYNEERPKKAIDGMTPSAYAQQLANTDIINPGL
ncbi:transposase (plasmid) [Xanthomonas axonopodis pv. vasculorum]